MFGLKQAMSKPRETSDVLNEWLYRFEWEQDEMSVADDGPAGGDWLLLHDSGGVAGGLAGPVQ